MIFLEPYIQNDFEGVEVGSVHFLRLHDFLLQFSLLREQFRNEDLQGTLVLWKLKFADNVGQTVEGDFHVLVLGLDALGAQQFLLNERDAVAHNLILGVQLRVQVLVQVDGLVFKGAFFLQQLEVVAVIVNFLNEGMTWTRSLSS